MAARIIFAQKWKQIDTPSLEDWIGKLINFIDLDSLTKYFRNQDKEQFEVNWQKFKRDLENKKNLSTPLIV